jgi:hypothetical protein
VSSQGELNGGKLEGDVVMPKTEGKLSGGVLVVGTVRVAGWLTGRCRVEWSADRCAGGSWCAGVAGVGQSLVTFKWRRLHQCAPRIVAMGNVSAMLRSVQQVEWDIAFEKYSILSFCMLTPSLGV